MDTTRVTRKSLLEALCFASIMMLAVGCGGAGGGEEERTKQDGEDGSIEVHGTVREDGAGVQGVEVCALGECDTTGARGEYRLSVPSDEFEGGDVLFTFESDTLDTETVATDLPGNRNLAVDFSIRGSNVEVDAVRSEDVVTPGQDDDDEIVVHGTVRENGAGVGDAVVCALGDCDSTNERGEYRLSVPSGEFNGGDVLFTIESGDVEAETVARDLPGGNQDATVDFSIRGDSVQVDSVRAGGVIPPDDDGDGIDDDEVDDVDNEDGEVQIRGNVRGVDQDVVVCALGDCDDIDEDDGSYEISVPAELFNGGEVLFLFQGRDFDSNAVADLPSGDSRADFVLVNGQASVVRVVEDRDSEDDIDDIEDEIDDIGDEIDDDIDEIDDNIDDDIDDDIDEIDDVIDDEVDDIDDDSPIRVGNR